MPYLGEKDEQSLKVTAIAEKNQQINQYSKESKQRTPNMKRLESCELILRKQLVSLSSVIFWPY